MNHRKLLETALAKMRSDGAPDEALAAFRRCSSALFDPQEFIRESGIDPVTIEDVERSEDQDAIPDGMEKLQRQLAVVRLNGGLGTTMGLDEPKCLLEIRPGMTLLGMAVRQIRSLTDRWGFEVPLLFMNSFHTDDATRRALSDLSTDTAPACFCQHRFPRIDAERMAPFSCPHRPSLEWAPPGHGDIYAALKSSGMLDRLIARGKRYAFVSNIDNAGSAPCAATLARFARSGSPFTMEVIRRGPMHRKGGHLARDRKKGTLILREIAQVPPENIDAFQDIARYPVFNTNNIWLDLHALKKTLESGGGLIPLSVIRNRKPADSREPSSPAVIQLETAMGSAISVFPGARAVAVSSHRYLPVKRCEDLLILRSDSFREDGFGGMAPVTATIPVLNLDSRYYSRVEDLEKRFPHGPPRLAACRSLAVEGDVRFGRGVAVRGDAMVVKSTPGQGCIPDGTVISGKMAVD